MTGTQQALTSATLEAQMCVHPQNRALPNVFNDGNLAEPLIGTRVIHDTLPSDPGVPIYNLAGLEVAADATQGSGGLFSGSIFNPINVTETGQTISTAIVWTGSTANGGNNPSDALGTTAYGGAEIYVGYAGPAYLSGDWLSAYLYGSSAGLPLYAISSVMTVPADSPEPSTMAFSILCAVLLCAVSTNSRAKRSGEVNH